MFTVHTQHFIASHSYDINLVPSFHFESEIALDAEVVTHKYFSYDLLELLPIKTDKNIFYTLTSKNSFFYLFQFSTSYLEFRFASCQRIMWMNFWETAIWKAPGWFLKHLFTFSHAK